MPYVANTPLSSDNLANVSQPQFNANFSALNTVNAINHYAFDDTTSNLGKHRVVQTPVQVVIPLTVADEPAFYCSKPLSPAGTAPIPALQFSRLPSNGLATPLTCMQSPSTPITMNAATSINIADLTNITNTLIEFYAYSVNSSFPSSAGIFVVLAYNGTVINFINNVSGQSGVKFTLSLSAGKVLVLTNSSGGTISNVYWTLKFLRIQ